MEATRESNRVNHGAESGNSEQKHLLWFLWEWTGEEREAGLVLTSLSSAGSGAQGLSLVVW